MQDHVRAPRKVRAARFAQPFPRTQRELVELSIKVGRTKSVRPVIERDAPRGVFR